MESKIVQKVKEAVTKIEPSAEIILYGSRARNDYREGSDWDFFVLVDGKVDYIRTDKIRHQLHEIEWDTGEVLCAIVRSKGEWEDPQNEIIPLFKNIRLEGIKI